jgi:WD40 repeat protein
MSTTSSSPPTPQTQLHQLLTTFGGFTDQDANQHTECLHHGGCTSLEIFKTLTEQELKTSPYGFNKTLIIRGIMKAIEECKKTMTTTNNTDTINSGIKSRHSPFSVTKDPPPCDILANHEEGINAVAFSHDNLHLYSVSDDCTIGVWDVNTAKLVKQLRKHSSRVSAVATSPTCHIFVTGDAGGGIIFWNGNEETNRAGKFSVRNHVMKHTSPINSFAFTSNGNFVMSFSMIQNKGILWNVEQGMMLITTTSGGSSGIYLPVETCPSMFFIGTESGSGKTTMHCCDIISNQDKPTSFSNVISSITGNVGGNALALTRDGKHLINVGDQGNVSIYKIIQVDEKKPPAELVPLDFKFSLLKRVQGHNKKTIYSVAATWTLIATGGADSTVHIWSLFENGEVECVNILTSKYSSPIYGLAFTRDGQMLVTGSTDSSVKFYLA